MAHFDISSRKFIEEPENFIPRGATILNGNGPPRRDLGQEDDFYIDILEAELYGPKGMEWGAPIPLRGPQGVSVIGAPGESGGEGKSGATGQTGTDGRDGIRGVPGMTGIRGQSGTTGRDGREIELGRNTTHVQWRYVGDKGWIDLFAIPKSTRGGGSGAALVELERVSKIAIKEYRAETVAFTFLPTDYHVEQQTAGVTDTLPATIAAVAVSRNRTTENNNNRITEDGDNRIVESTISISTGGLLDSGQIFIYSNVSSGSTTLQTTNSELINIPSATVTSVVVLEGESLTVQVRPGGGWKLV